MAPMTPPPDPVAALADCEHATIQTWRSDDGVVRLWACADCRLRFQPATLSHDSERRSAVIGSERSDNEALVTLLGLPWHADAPVPGVATITFDFQGDRHALARFVNMLTDARAAIEGRP